MFSKAVVLSISREVNIQEQKDTKLALDLLYGEERKRTLTWEQYVYEKNLKLDDNRFDFIKKVFDELEAITFTPDFPEVIAPRMNNKEERVIVHDIAKALGLLSFSIGRWKKRRVIIVDMWKLITQNKVYNYIVARGCSLYVLGPTIEKDSLKQPAHDFIKSKSGYIANRERRDGPLHHISILRPEDMKEMLKKDGEEGEEVIEPYNMAAQLELFRNIDSDWKDLGLGKGANDTDETYFRIVSWPTYDNICAKYSIKARDLHITLGFLSKDMHDIRKDITTLVSSDEMAEEMTENI